MSKHIMKNRVAVGLLIFWFVFTLTMFVGCRKKDEVDTTEELGLRILYAGHPGSSRETEFVKFLTEHFKGVQKGDLAQFKEQHADGFDVIILDYDGEGFKAPRPRLSSEYKRPTVTVGVAGARICSGMSLKTGYL